MVRTTGRSVSAACKHVAGRTQPGTQMDIATGPEGEPPAANLLCVDIKVNEFHQETELIFHSAFGQVPAWPLTRLDLALTFSSPEFQKTNSVKSGNQCYQQLLLIFE